MRNLQYLRGFTVHSGSVAVRLRQTESEFVPSSRESRYLCGPQGPSSVDVRACNPWLQQREKEMWARLSGEDDEVSDACMCPENRANNLCHRLVQAAGTGLSGFT